jgi:diadenosine tetraphosphatase ApaH/serine/threonine PP2A family protein phosphatase
MRIAILGDIHANLEALEAVLADARAHEVGAFACVGDVVGYNADPVACLDILRSLDCPVVKGNHDADAGSNHSLESMNPVAAEALEWTRAQLDDGQRQWLRRLRMVRQIEDFTIVHSTLDQPNSWNYVTNRFDAMSNFAFQFTPICFHGHTHVPCIYVKSAMVRTVLPQQIIIQPGAQYFINVGSVGQPRDGDPRACYAVYDTAAREVVFRRVAYDVSRTQHKILAAGLPAVLAERLDEGK